MPRGLGPATGSPSTLTSPRSGRSKPAMMFSRVVLPQPEGPTTATNSPSETAKSIASSTGNGPSRVGKVFETSLTRILSGITPAHHPELFEASHEAVEQKPDDADHHHPRHHQIVSVPGVSRIHDQKAEPRVEGNHRGRDPDEPRNAETDAHSDDDVRKGGGDDDEAQQPEAGDSEVLGRVDVLPLDRVNARRGVDDHGKERR